MRGTATVATLICFGLACSQRHEPRLGAEDSPCSTASEGIFLLDLASREIVQLAGYDNAADDLNPIKYSFLDGGDGAFDFAFVPDLDGDLYHFQVQFDGDEIVTSDVERKLGQTDDSMLNGPAYCERQRALAFGDVGMTATGVELIDAEVLRELGNSTVTQARAAGLLTTVHARGSDVAADLNCRNLERGVVFSGLDCRDSSSVRECLATSRNVAAIHLQASATEPAEQLTFPDVDPVVAASPDRPPGNPLGDADPNVVSLDDGRAHLMFERVHATAATFDDPLLPAEFKSTGSSRLMYKRFSPDEAAPTEYALDFSRWLPAEHQLLVFPYLSATEPPDRVRFAALGVFKDPDPTMVGQQRDLFTGLLVGRFDASDLPDEPEAPIVLAADAVEGALTFAEFACYAWDRCGTTRDGSVYLYALYSPQFLHGPNGHEYLAFSTSKSRLGTVSGGDVTFADGTSQPVAALGEAICHPYR